MFSTKLSRVAHRTPAAAIIAGPSSTATAHLPAPCVASRRPHQRRHSSSKASCPPEGSPSGSKPAPATKASSTSPTDAANTESTLSPSSGQARPKRVSRAKKARPSPVNKVEDQFAGLPSVQNTQGWRYNDFSMSSFFSLHRPLSLTSQFPRAYSADEFANVFDSQSSDDVWANGNSAERRPEDVVYALYPLMQEMHDGSLDAQDGGSPWDLGQDGFGQLHGAKKLDGEAASKTVDKIIAQYQHMPFEAPPPPEPFPEEKPGKKRQAKGRTTIERQIRDHLNSPRSRQRSFQTTITMTESTTEDGQTILIAERSPFVQVENNEVETPSATSRSSLRTRRRHVVRRPIFHASLPNRPRRADASTRVFFQVEWLRTIRRAPTKRVDMILISVKRQRKLKMKKHKYKKLMKKTRNLRRRQDRA